MADNCLIGFGQAVRGALDELKPVRSKARQRGRNFGWMTCGGSLPRTNLLNNSCGCGGVVRVAPVGLHLPDPDDTLQDGATAAAITHGHPMGFIPAVGLTYIVNRLVRSSRPDRG